MWFWSSGFGPGPSVTPMAPAPNGSAGPKLIAAKNAAITYITINAHPTSTSLVRDAEPPRDRRGVPAEDQRPQQDRTLQGRPHRGEVVERRRVGGPDLLHVRHREVAGDQRPLHHHDRQHDAAEGHPRIARTLLQETLVASAHTDEHRQGADDAGRQHQQQPGPARARR